MNGIQDRMHQALLVICIVEYSKPNHIHEPSQYGEH